MVFIPPFAHQTSSPSIHTNFPSRIWGQLEETFARSRDYRPTSKEWLTSSWNGFASPKDLATKVLPHLPTSVDHSLLLEIGKTISTYPPDFTVHPNLKRIITNRGKSVLDDTGVDMSTAEALAFGTLVKEGYNIRVSGQDVERGTFSQRHAVLHDQKTEKTYVPLMHVEREKAGSFDICNSSLSEYGVLGFEYGYSLSSPQALVMCEMQFGDFANVIPKAALPHSHLLCILLFDLFVFCFVWGTDDRTHNVLLTSFWLRVSQSGNNDQDLCCLCPMDSMDRVQNIQAAELNDSCNSATKIPVSSHLPKSSTVSTRYPRSPPQQIHSPEAHLFFVRTAICKLCTAPPLLTSSTSSADKSTVNSENH